MATKPTDSGEYRGDELTRLRVFSSPQEFVTVVRQKSQASEVIVLRDEALTGADFGRAKSVDVGGDDGLSVHDALHALLRTDLHTVAMRTESAEDHLLASVAARQGIEVLMLSSEQAE